MHLVNSRQRRPRQYGRDRTAAVLGHGLAVVLGSVADVEPRHDPLGNAAAAPEEAVRDSGQSLGADDLYGFSQGCG